MTRRVIWLFPGDGNWYRIEVPYSEEFAEELHCGHKPAWRALLGGLSKLVEAGRTAAE